MKYATAIHRRDIIRGVRARWLDQYKNYRADQTLGFANGRTVGVVRAALERLDLETCSAADVDAAIGASGWVKNGCDECDGDFPVLLRFGQEPDYDARWWSLCPDCLGKARDLLASIEAKP